jgi:hypothetical protein
MKIVSNFLHKNEKWLTPIVLLGGFVLDNLTLRRSDLLAENILLAVYFVIILFGLLIWHTLEQKRSKDEDRLGYQSFIFLIIQFAFGGLFSSLTVFYIKSASFYASWPFLLLLFGGMIATEYFKKHFTQFLVQLVTLYILFFTYLILLVPLVVRAINYWTFLLSGILSLVAIFGYVLLFKIYIPKLIKGREAFLVSLIGTVFIFINVLYFTNIIPPIPLALKDSGIYQKVEKKAGTYTFVGFDNKFYFKNLKQEYYIPSGTPVYFYTSVYAPIKFNQKIVHEWQKKNTKNEWVTILKIDFPIYGGNTNGYRGYSVSNKITTGEYRVLVEIDNGQVLGIKKFIVTQ